MTWNPFRQDRPPPPLFCEPDISRGLQPFWDELARTIAWCEPRVNAADPRDCLRSAEFRPRVLESSYADSVRTVGLRRYPRTERPGSPTLPSGRLLVYHPDADLADGAAEVESGGFLDVNNCPPWDTWVALATDLAANRDRQVQLISWVPDTFIPHVQRGIDVNISEYVAWLDESDTRFARMVAADRGRAR